MNIDIFKKLAIWALTKLLRNSYNRKFIHKIGHVNSIKKLKNFSQPTFFQNFVCDYNIHKLSLQLLIITSLIKLFEFNNFIYETS